MQGIIVPLPPKRNPTNRSSNAISQRSIPFPWGSFPCHTKYLGDVAKKLSLKYKLALLVLLRSLVCFIVLPANGLLALLAGDIAYDVSSGRHVSFAGLACLDVDDAVK